MTIGEVARASGVPASAIRYYESIGVIAHPERKSGIRQFAPDAVDEIKALRFYRESGIPVRGLAAIGATPRGTAARGAMWRSVMQARIDDLDAWMREARATKRTLERVIACRCGGRLDRCEAVRAAETAPAARPRS